jgi:hypothetical protein
VRHHVGCLERLSQSLRMREDRGEHPVALGRTDMKSFLHRLAYLEQVIVSVTSCRLLGSKPESTDGHTL